MGIDDLPLSGQQQMARSRLQTAFGTFNIPHRMHGGLIRYVLWGIPPGEFLQAVIANDLKDAAGRADDENQLLLWNYAGVLYNGFPAGAQGSRQALAAWSGHNGLAGGDFDLNTAAAAAAPLVEA